MEHMYVHSPPLVVAAPTGFMVWLRASYYVSLSLYLPTRLHGVITQNNFEVQVMSWSGLRLCGILTDYARYEILRTVLVEGSTILRQVIKQEPKDTA